MRLDYKHHNGKVLLTWTSQESLLEPFQTSNRSQDQPCKQLFVWPFVTAIIRKKHKLSAAAERKLVRMVKSQPRTTKKQFCNELEAAGTQVPVFTASMLSITRDWEVAVQEGSHCLRSGTFRHDWSLLLIAWTKIRPSGGKFCDQIKQKLRC